MFRVCQCISATPYYINFQFGLVLDRLAGPLGLPYQRWWSWRRGVLSPGTLGKPRFYAPEALLALRLFGVAAAANALEDLGLANAFSEGSHVIPLLIAIKAARAKSTPSVLGAKDLPFFLGGRWPARWSQEM